MKVGLERRDEQLADLLVEGHLLERRRRPTSPPSLSSARDVCAQPAAMTGRRGASAASASVPEPFRSFYL